MRYLLMLILAVLGTVQLQGATPADTNQRPRVALVLSGGGAKGMAHIGVLRVLEKAGIPIDIITGTSMGSLVGGLYSVGWNAEKLDSIVRVQDWSFLLSDKAVYSSQNLADREKQNTYLLSKTITARKRILGETGGLIQGKNIYRLLTRLTAGYTDSIDFNHLPIPFACVATNIMDNSEYDFHSGQLARAMRASMAIPAAFTPITLDGMVLVDGGLRNNYPADLAREMGADYIIGVTVQGKEKTADELSTSASVLGQIVDINCKNKYDDNLSITDIPIRVNPAPYGTTSFSAVAIDSLVKRGEAEAMKHWDELMALKRRIGLDDDYRPAVPQPNAEALLPVDYMDTTQTARPAQATITGSLGVRFDTEDMVALQLNGLYRSARKPFDIDATIRLGNRTKVGATATWTPRHLAAMSIGYLFSHNKIDIYSKGENDFRVTINHHEINLSLANIKLRNLDMDLSTRFDFYHLPKVLTSGVGTDIDKKNSHFISYHAILHYNSENAWSFPTRGAQFKAEYAYYTDNFVEHDHHIGFSELMARWQMSFPLSTHLTLQPMLYGRMLFGSDVPDIRGNYIGGEWFGHYFDQQMPFAGVRHVEIADRHFIACQLRFQERLTKNNYVLLKIAAAQHASRQRNLLKHGPMMGYELAYYYDTMLGPVGASTGYSNHTDELNLFLNLGFRF